MNKITALLGVLTITVSGLVCASHLEEGHAAFEKRQIKKAMANYRLALKENPGSIEAKIGLAKCFRGKPMYFNHVKQLTDEVLAIDSNNVEALKLRADLLYRTKRWKEAEIALRKVLAKEPNNEVAQISLANVLKYQGNDNASRSLYRDIKANRTQGAP